MASFSEALIAAKEGESIIHPQGLNKPLVMRWVPVGDGQYKDHRLVHETDIGYLTWVPHQWEILSDDWEILKC